MQGMVNWSRSRAVGVKSVLSEERREPSDVCKSLRDLKIQELIWRHLKSMDLSMQCDAVPMI